MFLFNNKLAVYIKIYLFKYLTVRFQILNIFSSNGKNPHGFSSLIGTKNTYTLYIQQNHIFQITSVEQDNTHMKTLNITSRPKNQLIKIDISTCLKNFKLQNLNFDKKSTLNQQKSVN